LPSDPGDGGFRAAAFGLRWQSDIPLTPVFGPDAADGAADIRVCHEAPLPERGGGAPLLRGQVFADGVRFAAGGSATFDLVDGDCITYCPGPAWRGELPVAFFGSVAALTLASRSFMPAPSSKMGARSSSRALAERASRALPPGCSLWGCASSPTISARWRWPLAPAACSPGVRRCGSMPIWPR
jgi:hypothetical protein